MTMDTVIVGSISSGIPFDMKFLIVFFFLFSYTSEWVCVLCASLVTWVDISKNFIIKWAGTRIYMVHISELFHCSRNLLFASAFNMWIKENALSYFQHWLIHTLYSLLEWLIHIIFRFLCVSSCAIPFHIIFLIYSSFYILHLKFYLLLFGVLCIHCRSNRMKIIFGMCTGSYLAGFNCSRFRFECRWR